MPYCNVSAMPNNEGLQTTHNPASVNQLSIFICEAIISVLQQHPELVVANYQSINWKRSDYQSALLASLNKKIGSIADTSVIVANVRQYLEIFLVQSFFYSPDFHQLETRIRSFIHPQTNTLQEFKNGKSVFISSAIAILLLDAENLQLNTEIEKFLSTVCTYPIQVKIAFANWCSMGKLDVEFHIRGYDLIHVPAGRDNADGKMITFGSSIRERYPNAKEVLVCSSDQVMTNLCNHLQQHGLTVYRVSKQGSNIKIFNSHNSVNKIYPVLPSIEQFIKQIKDIIISEKKITSNQWISLSKISQIYQIKYHLDINKLVSELCPGKRPNDIFTDKSEFVVHKPPEDNELYVALFKMHQPNNQGTINSVQLKQISNKTALEQALFNILRELSGRNPNTYIPIESLSGQFRNQYNQTISNVLENLQFSGNFPNFLDSCSCFQLQRRGLSWQVALLQAARDRVIT